MKQKVQLFINNEEVDVFQDGSITIQSSIKDVKDPGKIFTDFSKNFTLPASANNNKIFKHYYNYAIDIVDSGGFDAAVAQEARIEINNRVFREGYIMLEGVDLKYNKPSTYRVTFYGNLRFLREKLDNTKLSDLTFLKNFYLNYQPTGTDSVYEFLTSSKNITDENGTTHTQPLVVPLITHTDRLYYNSDTTYYGVLADGNLYYDGSNLPTTYPKNGFRNGVSWDQLKPGIRIDIIIKAIEKLLSEEDQTVSFSTDFFNSTNLDYYNLYMWLHQKEGKIDSEDEQGKITTLIDKFNIGTIPSYVSGTSAVGFTAQFINSSGIGSGAAADKVKITINSPKVESVLARLSLVSSDTTTKYDVRIERNGVTYKEFTQEVQTGTTDYLETELDEGTYTFTVITESGASINFDSGFELRLIARIDRDYFDGSVNVPDIVRTASNLSTNATGVFYTRENLPDITVLDFLSGIFKLFNLVAEVRNDSPTQKTIVVKTLDDFYTSSLVETDLTNNIDIQSSSVNKTLPYTKVTFEYEDTGSLLAKQHKEANNITWGGEFADVKGDSRYEKEYTIKPPFGHMKFERLKDDNTGTFSDVQVGFSVTKSNEDAAAGTQEKYNPYIGKPVLFYPILLTSATEIPYVYNDRAANTTTTSYFIPSNAVSTQTSQTNHFGAEKNEYNANVDGSESYTDNLFSQYYKNYISSVFNQFNRLTKLKAILTNAFISNFSLADTVVVRGEKYNINKINLDIVTGKADLELISTYAAVSYLCLPSLFEVRVEAITGGYIYIFSNRYGVYQLAAGTYTFSNVPSGHPIAFHNNGKESLISYTGAVNAGSKTGLDGNTYTYYSGDVTVTVNGDFGTISYECYNHGYMGGENNLTYNATCSVAPTPTPETGNLTVDATDISVDSALITADQTDE
ncbi:MAG: hypothetical protein Tp156SUR476192_6 [Prokaryotic dsDNA virus sp.]|nr:MAG: hypothetical protein Tp156SUR476192_6 [Prokaryotic dsDNA virus sp.]|tara:strand:- start:21567 stop:24296 length:2730 start_codon:yes stop_codon:yes gene_type:complete